jgi:V8-like Glu-specific endopeptidase
MKTAWILALTACALGWIQKSAAEPDAASANREFARIGELLQNEEAWRPENIEGTRQEIRAISLSVFLSDNTRDVSLTSVGEQVASRAIALLVNESSLTTNANGTRNLKVRSSPICSLPGDSVSGGCTAFLVSPERAITAGHCLGSYNNLDACTDWSLVFDFLPGSPSSAQFIPSTSVKKCAQVLAGVRNPASGADWRLIRLESPVTGRPALNIDSSSIASNADLVAMGHPVGLPLKAVDNGKIFANSDPGFFETDLDAYPNSSGSPVFLSTSLTTGDPKVVGIISSGGLMQFRAVPGTNCSEAVSCTAVAASGPCGSQLVTRSSVFAAAIAQP